MQPAWNWS